MRGSSFETSSASSSLLEVSTPNACSLNVSSPPISPEASTSRRNLSKPASSAAPVGEPIERHAVERHVRHAAALVRLKRAHARRRGNPARRMRAHSMWPIFGASPTNAGTAGSSAPCNFRHHRAERRPAAGRLPLEGPAGEALKSVVARVAVRHRADERAAIHHLRELRQMLGDLDAGDIGRDRLELAAKLRRRVHLQVENVLMRRPARQENHDHRLVRPPRPGLRLRAQDLRQAQPPERQPADPQEIATRNPIAKTSGFRAEDGEHEEFE